MSRSALHLSESEAIDLGVRARSRPSLIDMRDNPAERVKRGQKYGNTKVKEGDRTFDSKAEHRRWQYLVALEKAREIRNLQCQVRFELIPALDKPSGGRERPTHYVADFVYEAKDGRRWIRVVEDVKGAVTPEFRLKRKLMLHVHGIEVQEIRS